MHNSFLSRFGKFAIAAACATLLAACGGGDGDGNDSGAGTPVPTPVPAPGPAPAPDPTPAPSASQILEQQKVGLTSTANAYNLALSIGDTWRLVLDPVSKTYTLTVIQTAFAAGQLSNGASRTGSYTLSDTGTLVETHGDWELRVDATTQSVTGQVQRFAGQAIVVGGQPVISQVNGTSYAAPADLSRFKGTYFVTGAMRNAGNGGSPWAYRGQLRVADDGKSYQLCANGLFNAEGKCSAVDANEAPSEGTFHLMSEAATGLIRVKDSAGGDQGVMTFQLNGLGGYTLIHDRIGRNEEGVLRTGMAYATTAMALKMDDIGGRFQCSDVFPGNSISSIIIVGHAIRIGVGFSGYENTLIYNQFRNQSGALIDMTGIMASSASRHLILHPISRDTLVTEYDYNGSVSQALCMRQF